VNDAGIVEQNIDAAQGFGAGGENRLRRGR
jgi:hypothetical protein